MPQLVNPTHEALTLPGVGRIEAGGSLDVDETVAAAFTGHPVINVAADAPAAPQAAQEPQQVTVSEPAAGQDTAAPVSPAANTEAAE